MKISKATHHVETADIADIAQLEKHWTAANRKLEHFLSCCIPLHTSRLAIHLTPRCAILRASHADCAVFRYCFREAEGSAPPHRKAIQDYLDDRLP